MAASDSSRGLCMCIRHICLNLLVQCVATAVALSIADAAIELLQIGFGTRVNAHAKYNCGISR